MHKDDEKIDLTDANHIPSTEGSKEDSEESAENLRPLLLIVEDNSDIRQYIEDSLQEDYRILQACNGKEGKDLALAQMPDLIVSDIMMPEMDGIEMTKILKEDIRTSHIPIILLTAKTSANDQQEGYDSGADSYLMKPLVPSYFRVASETSFLEEEDWQNISHNRISPLFYPRKCQLEKAVRKRGDAP